MVGRPTNTGYADNFWDSFRMTSIKTSFIQPEVAVSSHAAKAPVRH